MGTRGRVAPATECRRLRLDGSSDVGRWRHSLIAGKGTKQRAKAEASLLHHQAVSKRQRVGRATTNYLHDITKGVRAGQEPKQMRMMGTLRLH